MNISNSTPSTLVTNLQESNLPVILPDSNSPEMETFAEVALAQLLIKELERAIRSFYVHPTQKKFMLEALLKMHSLSYDELLRALCCGLEVPITMSKDLTKLRGVNSDVLKQGLL